MSGEGFDMAGPEDLLVALRGQASRLDRAEAVLRRLLSQDSSPAAPPGEADGDAPLTIMQAERDTRGDAPRVAFLSMAGEYARYEAAQALAAGLDVVLYSDNISLQDERALKELALRRGRLLAGPGCGAAIIDGVPLAFANRVRKGSVGIAATSGTGLQEASCLLDRMGLGVSQAYGTGGRDMQDEIGGISTLTAFSRLARDSATHLIAIIAKNPGEATRRRLLDAVRRQQKPVVLLYLGASDTNMEKAAGIPIARSLTELALLAARTLAPLLDVSCVGQPDLPLPAARLPGFLRGVFSGSTLCIEAAETASRLLASPVRCNIPLPCCQLLPDGAESAGHAFLDMSAAAFTVGRAHPLMAPEHKFDRVTQELVAQNVAAVMTDIVLGCGTAPNQAALLVRSMDQAAALSHGRSRGVEVVASVCGTENDSPSRSSQLAILRQAGVRVLGSNAQAAVWAASRIARAEKRPRQGHDR